MSADDVDEGEGNWEIRTGYIYMISLAGCRCRGADSQIERAMLLIVQSSD